MVIDYRMQIRSAAAAVGIHRAGRISWFGRASTVVPVRKARSLSSSDRVSYLRFALERRLYQDFYCKGLAVPSEPATAARSPAGDPGFVFELSRANTGQGAWEPGWMVRGSHNGMLVAEKNGMRVRVEPEVLSNVGAADSQTAQLRLPHELRAVSPGFYMALGDATLADEGRLIRWYWNIQSAGAISLMKRVTTALNGSGVPFRLKIANDPAQFRRRDCAVLYLRAGDHACVSKLLSNLFPRIAVHLRPGVPALTKLLAPGLGLAEDPGNGESFGYHRCRLIADAILASHHAGRDGIEDRLQEIAERFEVNGLRIDSPYLSPDSSDIYDVAPAKLRNGGARAVDSVAGGLLDPRACLQTAAQLGHELRRTAVWHGKACNWVGPILPGDTAGAPTERPEYEALGGDLYSGTAGIALYLAELSSATSDRAIGRTAQGAIRHALAQTEREGKKADSGFYAGWSGVAAAAARVGVILGDESLVLEGRRLARSHARTNRPSGEFDLVLGKAGAITGLLLVHEITADSDLMDFACRLADRLLRSAKRSRRGLSWSSRQIPSRRNLTGLSHGAAGAAYVLLELHRKSGVDRYRSGARDAFAYEASWFDAVAENWPDFRVEEGYERAAKLPSPFASSWCHGAPGIALTRLRAFDLTGDRAYLAEAAAALRTTSAWVRSGLHDQGSGLSLCHGMSGNAEILYEGREATENGSADEAFLVAQFIRTALGLSRPSPGGAPPHDLPQGLMLGIAGIGYFYLRLADAGAPSLLLPRPERFAAAGSKSSTIHMSD